MLWFPSRVRHPFCPGIAATRVAASAGQSAALAGTFEELKTAALSGSRVRQAIFILIHEGAAWPGREQRDALWQLFQVPAYVICLDHEGRQLGWECEAQDGLHAAGESIKLPGFRLETGTCACGRPGTRLVREAVEQLAIAK